MEDEEFDDRALLTAVLDETTRMIAGGDRTLPDPVNMTVPVSEVFPDVPEEHLEPADELEHVQERGHGHPSAPFHDDMLGDVEPGRDGVPSGLQPNAARGAAAARQLLGFTGTIGGLGERSNKSDHPHGNAIDLMTHQDTELGWRLADWYWQNRDGLGVTYIIFNGKIASPRNGWQWRPYRHPSGKSNPTLDHDDHVHVSFRGGQQVTGTLTPPRPAEAPAKAAPPPGKVM